MSIVKDNHRNQCKDIAGQLVSGCIDGVIKCCITGISRFARYDNGVKALDENVISNRWRGCLRGG